jgi:hypothetical protein
MPNGPAGMDTNSERCAEVGLVMVMVFCAFTDGRRNMKKMKTAIILLIR